MKNCDAAWRLTPKARRVAAAVAALALCAACSTLEPPAPPSPESGAGTLHLSSLLGWYEGDFERWLAERRPKVERSLRGYVLLHAAGEKETTIRDCTDCKVAFVPHDWGLNDQRDPARAARTPSGA